MHPGAVPWQMRSRGRHPPRPSGGETLAPRGGPGNLAGDDPGGPTVLFPVSTAGLPAITSAADAAAYRPPRLHAPARARHRSRNESCHRQAGGCPRRRRRTRVLCLRRLRYSAARRRALPFSMILPGIRSALCLDLGLIVAPLCAACRDIQPPQARFARCLTLLKKMAKARPATRMFALAAGTNQLHLRDDARENRLKGDRPA